MNYFKYLLKNRNFLTFTSIRNCSLGELEPIQYPGFEYYPRDKNFKDPPIKPSKLFLVRRIKRVSGTTKEEKACLKTLNIFSRGKGKQSMAVVPNIPETNALLWKVKHLVDIKPIFWNQELPKDGLGTVLRLTGELVISPKLKVTEETLNDNSIENNKISRSYMQQYLKRKWVKGL